MFFGGNIELNLAQMNRFVVAHTNKYVIYEFWDCVMKEPKKIGDMSKFLFSATEPNIFYILQENWPKYNDPYLRSAMFFLLNRKCRLGTRNTRKMKKSSFSDKKYKIL